MNSLLVHVGVRASDLAASLRFWRDALGLQVVSEIEGNTDLSDGYQLLGRWTERRTESARPRELSITRL
jgi:catechol 2,3-dioxygenase-like lactoylglutathione lyase family enzyme